MKIYEEMHRIGTLEEDAGDVEYEAICVIRSIIGNIGVGVETMQKEIDSSFYTETIENREKLMAAFMEDLKAELMEKIFNK